MILFVGGFKELEAHFSEAAERERGVISIALSARLLAYSSFTCIPVRQDKKNFKKLHSRCTKTRELAAAFHFDSCIYASCSLAMKKFSSIFPFDYCTVTEPIQRNIHLMSRIWKMLQFVQLKASEGFKWCSRLAGCLRFRGSRQMILWTLITNSLPGSTSVTNNIPTKDITLALS